MTQNDIENFPLKKKLFLNGKDVMILKGYPCITSPYYLMRKIAQANNRAGTSITFEEFCRYESVSEEKVMQVYYNNMKHKT